MQSAIQYLRSFCDAYLAVGASDSRRLDSVRYVIDPKTGVPVCAARKELHEAEELILHIPDDADTALHIQVTAQEIGDSAARDRYLICLGTPRDKASVCYYLLTPQWAKFNNETIAGEEILAVNPWESLQGKLCSSVNKEPQLLARLAQHAGVNPKDVPDIKLVGIDPDGIDLRGPLGVIRGTPQDARQLYSDFTT